MTVAAETQPTTNATRQAAEQQTEEIYKQYWKRIRSFIWTRLPASQTHLAEDLASETFIELWVKYVAAGKDVERPFGLLCAIARSKIGEYLRLGKSGEVTLDFTDPVNTPVLASGHSYAFTIPGVAHLVVELDVAMEQMTMASKTWRDKHKDSYALRRLTDDDFAVGRGGITRETKLDAERRRTVVEAEQKDALRVFRNACGRVGDLRASIEAAAGPNWKSSIGLPSSIAAVNNGSHRSYRSNMAITHCPEGHLMDLDNTHFGEDGARRCRACRKQVHAQRRDANPAPGISAKTVDDEVIQTARKMLTDPANGHRSIADIAAELGIGAATIHRRIADHVRLRPRAGTTPQATLDQARQMLLDPNGTMSIQQVANAVGVSHPTISRNLPEESAVCIARITQSRVSQEALDKARAMLTDPSGTLGMYQIAKSCGVAAHLLETRLPREVAACHARKEARRKATFQTARALLRDPDGALTLDAIADTCGISATHLRHSLPRECADYKARRAERRQAAALFPIS